MAGESISLSVTPRAVEELQKFVRRIFNQSEWIQAGIRIKVIPGGCSGFQYDMSVEEKPRTADTVIETQGIRIFIDYASKRFLNGIEIDFKDTLMNSGFVFNNPNATDGCHCGSSFSV
ncbi:MAG: iron-sulfur cluster assembly accessory protein [Parcubacteria group bacterium]|nr:iron-sulfur cluster assembly accessory protein [Parcubacteria group bacterium]